MQQIKVFLIALLTIFVGSATAQTTSVSTIIVNDTTIADATSLADAIQKAGITDSTKVTSIEYKKGTLTGASYKEGDWALIRTLANLRSLITDDSVEVADVPSYEFGDLLCPRLKTIRLTTVKTVGNEAFYRNRLSLDERAFTTIDLPQVEKIGDKAFAYNTSLTSLSLPKCVTIGQEAFYGCTSLKSISLPSAEEIGKSAFYNVAIESLTSEMIPKIKRLNDLIFGNCLKLQSVSLDDVDSIAGAFYQCEALDSVKLPSVRTITSAAFRSCTALKSISLPELTTIGKESFYNCNNLSSVIVPKVTSIGMWAFTYCKSLESIDLPELTTIDEESFKDTQFKSLSFPKLVTMGKSAFLKSAITSAVFPEVTAISYEAFGGCKSLKSVSLPKTRVVNAYAFAETGLTSIVLPATDSVMNNIIANSNPEKIVLPNVRYIEARAFEGAKNLKAVYLPATPPYETGLFTGVDSVTMYILNSKGELLTGDALATALATYKKHIDYDATTGRWNGLKLTTTNTTAIESVNAGLTKIWSEGGSIYVSTPAATNLTVVSAIGRMIRMSAVPAGTTTIGNLSSGIYFVRLGNETRKIAVK